MDTSILKFINSINNVLKKIISLLKIIFFITKIKKIILANLQKIKESNSFEKQKELIGFHNQLKKYEMNFAEEVGVTII